MEQNVAVILQTSVIYFLIVISLRLFGKKELAQLSIVDLVFILLISNSVQNAMVGDFTDFKKGLLSAGALFIVNFLLKKILFHSEKWSKIVQGEPIILIYEGHINTENLEKTSISVAELDAVLREHGVDKAEKVDLAVLEIDGNISVLSNGYSNRTSKKRRAHKIIQKY